MSLRNFLIKDCKSNKQIKSCKQCLYEKECDQTHINLIVKALGQFVTEKRQNEQHLDDVSFLFYQERQPEKKIFEKGFNCALDELLEAVKEASLVPDSTVEAKKP
jgi:hypothetical protein